MNPAPAQTADKAPADKAGGDKPRPGLVAFVGAGPGADDLLTVRAAALLGRADLVIAATWVSERLAHLIPESAAVADSAGLADDPRMAVKAARAGQTVVRLFSGDPFMFCNAATEAALCAKARVPFEIVPGISAAT